MRLSTSFSRESVLLAVLAAFGAAVWVWLAVPVRGVAGPTAQAREPALPPAKVSDMVVHEWGTFLGMSSADGTALDGMYHEEHALPAFVHGRARDQLKLPQMFLKGETPVIYFYTKETQKVRVSVGFPHGIWTQWYPQASRVLPTLATQAEQSGRLQDGRICWYAEIVPRSALPQSNSKRSGAGSEIKSPLPQTSSDALWNHAREVDAAFVKTIDAARPKPAEEFERFLFYRGLGDARLPLRIDESGNGTLTLDPQLDLGDGVRDVFVLRVEGGRGAYTYRAGLRPGESASGVIPSMDQAMPLPEFIRKIGDDLATRLAGSGLFRKEASAMVNTWRSSYFQTEGVRALFVLPQSWTDAFIPMKVEPQPRKIVRVMVGRLEMLSAARQRNAEAAIAGFASDKPGEIARAHRFLYDQGRYLEPIIRHVARRTRDGRIKEFCGKLLLTDFVTDLRAALHNASDGKPLAPDALLLQAQLARLLRQVGRDSEARSQAGAVLQGLATFPLQPGQKIETAPAALEIKAVALEATGDDEKAAEAYAQRVELAARSLAPDFAESQIPSLRDWWIGRAYAACARRSGRSAAVKTSLRARLSRQTNDATGRSGERTARMMLAFLLEEEGKQSLAASQWRSMVTQPGAAAAPIPASQPVVSAKTGI
jgi:hypothetical protein